MSENILRLNLRKQWFDLIKSGEKKVEYRAVKKHWVSRLSGVGTKAVNDFSDVIEFIPKNFDFIEFRNGYGRDGIPAPSVMFQCLGIELHRNIECPLGIGDFFVIKIGDRYVG